MSDKNVPTEFDSASRCSSRTASSLSSRCSRSSHGSHRKSTNILVEVVALKVKLQYIDKEAKQRAELDSQDRNEASNSPSQIGRSRDCTGFC